MVEGEPTSLTIRSICIKAFDIKAHMGQSLSSISIIIDNRNSHMCFDILTSLLLQSTHVDKILKLQVEFELNKWF